jgi:hypothetical protein
MLLYGVLRKRLHLKAFVVQGVERWMVCTPLIVNVFVTLATHHSECHCKTLFETSCTYRIIKEDYVLFDMDCWRRECFIEARFKVYVCVYVLMPGSWLELCTSSSGAVGIAYTSCRVPHHGRGITAADGYLAAPGKPFACFCSPYCCCSPLTVSNFVFVDLVRFYLLCSPSHGIKESSPSIELVPFLCVNCFMW